MFKFDYIDDLFYIIIHVNISHNTYTAILDKTKLSEIKINEILTTFEILKNINLVMIKSQKLYFDNNNIFIRYNTEDENTLNLYIYCGCRLVCEIKFTADNHIISLNELSSFFSKCNI